MLAVILNLFLSAIKFIGGILSGAVSVTADALNNLTDAGSALLTMLGLKVAAMGSGSHHPEGHGRFEWIIALITSVSVTLVGWELLKSSIEAIKNPDLVVFHWFTVAALAVSIGAKVFLYFYNTKKSREKDSSSLRAAAADCISDAVSTSAVLLCMIIGQIFSLRLDGWCGALVSLFIIYNGIKSFGETANRVMGTVASDEDIEKLRAFVLGHAFVGGVYDLRVDDYGYGRRGTTMSITPKSGVTVEEAVRGATELRAELWEKGWSSAVIQVEYPQADGTARDIRQSLTDAVARLPYHLTVRDIHVLYTNGVPQIILGVDVPFEEREKEAEINDAIRALLPDDQGKIIARFMMAPSRHRHAMYRDLKLREKKHGNKA